ncbi:glycine betaine ABC transporter substrate-binding protein [Alteribacter aurantiacus]|uniref:glycine betaine ABC transporter substrate-binding protein n=1 Tax=Alteribacter aurantiacus TaxID=254410 RepID=UPI00042886B9|nr:glycine betaine ABC transporter substrate-binding protein [Alteribacter aurantiacus]
MKRYQKVGMSVLAVLLAIAACGVDEEFDETEESSPGEDEGEVAEDRDETIRLGVTNWTSTIPPTYIAKEILEDMGYTVELQEADAGAVYTGLSRGDLDVFMDAWLPDMHKDYMEQYEDSIESISVSYEEGELGWVVPEYVDDINTVEDLKGQEDLFDNRIFGIEEGAGMTETSREMIQSFDLDLDYVASSESGMLTEVQRHISSEEPILFLGWRPHPMFVDYDLRVLEGDEDYFATSEVHVVVNKDLAEKAPEAYEFLENWSIDIQDVEEMIVEIEEGGDEEEIAREWVEENEDLVSEMMGQ